MTARVPTRTDRYFMDKFQAMPAEGHTPMFQRMVEHPNIKIMLGTDFAEVRDAVLYRRLIYTGPIDEFFGFRYGKLPYRSLRFVYKQLSKTWHQPVGVVNYPQDREYTRTHRIQASHRTAAPVHQHHL